MSARQREKLSIVFRLNWHEAVEELQIGTNKIARHEPTGGISVARALQMIISCMRQSGMPEEFSENGKKFSVESYLQRVEREGKWSRTIEAGGLSFRFGRVPALKQAFISIEEIVVGSTDSWGDWVVPFLEEESFVQAWISDVEYDHWQNAKDPIEYEAAGRTYDHLPTKTNGLPPPLEQLEIDTSHNPGRWSLHPGYVEAVGAKMWLGKLFWGSVDESRRTALLEASWLRTEIVGNGVIHVVAAEQSFCDGRTEDIQNGIRVLLFG